MFLAIPGFRAVFPLVAMGLILVLASVFLVGRDVTFARNEAEAEVVAFADTSALAIQLVPTGELDVYLTDLLKHPAIATATVYSANGQRTTRRRASSADSSFIASVLPSLGEPV